MNILIVDDSRVMRKIIIRTLRQAGFEGHTIEQADDGQAALEQIDMSPPRFGSHRLEHARSGRH